MMISEICWMLYDPIIWDADPVLFEIGGFKMRWYGAMWGLSIMLCFLLALHLFKRYKLPIGEVSRLVEYAFFGGLIGARLGHILLYEPVYYWNHPIEIFKIWNGGLASHGGSIGVLVAAYLYTRSRNISFPRILDILAVGMPLLSSLIRIGNLFNSEIVGKATDVPWAFVFIRRDQIARHPSPLYEAIWYFIVFLIVYFFQAKKERPPLATLGLFILLTFGGRIFLEFFKAGVYHAQWYNIPFIIGGVLLLWWAYRKR